VKLSIACLRTSLRGLLCVGALCAASALSAVSAEAAMISYQVDVDTTILSFGGGRPGSTMKFDFVSAGPNALSAMATLSLTPFDTKFDSNPAVMTGDASGRLPDHMTLGNDPGMNELKQTLAFGKQFSFLLTLDIADALAGKPTLSSSSLTLSLIHPLGVPLLSSDPLGRLLSFDIGTDGKVHTQVFGPAVVRQVDTPAAVPEPATLLLVGTGVLAVVSRRRRREL
jgi:hypothetical protein